MRLPARRNIKSVSEEPVSEQRQKTFAVRLLVQRLVAVIFQYAVGDVFDFRRHVVETLRPQEIAVARLESASQNDMFVKVRMSGARCEPEVLGPPSGLNPALTAMASSSVDFPIPFSPMMKVTGLRNSSRRKLASAGTVYG